MRKINVGKITKRAKVSGMLLFIAFIIATARYAVRHSADLQAYYHHGPVFFLWTIVFLFFYALMVSRAEIVSQNTFANRYLRWLGKNVTLIYFLQWVLIGNIGTEIYKSIFSPLALCLAFAGILLTASFAGYFILRAKKNLSSAA